MPQNKIPTIKEDINKTGKKKYINIMLKKKPNDKTSSKKPKTSLD
jgi:hypothetical protein